MEIPMMTRTSSLWAAASALSLSLSLAAPAAAAPRADHSHELSFVVGREGVVEDGLFEELLTDGPVAPVGLRAGYGLAGPWSVVAGWQRAQRAQTIGVPYGDDDYGSVVQALAVQQITAGVKVQRPVRAWIAPYATLQGSALLGRYLLDENIDQDDNLNQLRSRAAAVGGVAALGVDLRPVKVGPVRLGTHLELGYGAHTRMRFEAGPEDARPLDAAGDTASLGEVALRGLHVQWGVGLRF
jgi:hypothetical protein